jgi:anti-anti-sigma factor
VLLSLAETEFIDSSGLSWLLECHQKFCDAGGWLVIHSVPPGVMDTLMMMRLELVLNLVENETDALKLVRGEDA